eukprot:10661462-Ditylum_brightwellii.AAC.1
MASDSSSSGETESDNEDKQSPSPPSAENEDVATIDGESATTAAAKMQQVLTMPMESSRVGGDSADLGNVTSPSSTSPAGGPATA